MADKKISALTGASTPLTGSEVLPIVQSGSTVKVSIANVTAGRDASALIYRAGLSPADQGGAAAPAGGLFLKNNGTAGANTVVARLSDGTYPNSALPTVELTGFGGGNGYSAAFWGTQFGGIVFATADTFGGTYTANLTLANGASGDATVNKGNLVIGTAGKGIDFSANTHAAGMTSELLNDYEEGTWTATISDGTTDATMNAGRRTGTYTRVGRQVTVHNYIATTSMTGVTGNLRIKGLPFTVGNSPTVGGSIGYCDSSMVFTLGQSMVLQTASGVDYIVIRYWNGAAGTPNMTGAQWGAVGEIGFTLTYFV